MSIKHGIFLIVTLVLMCFQSISTEQWFLSTDGKDDEDCGETIDEPCQNLHHVIKFTKENDVISIIAAHTDEEIQICKNLTDPLEIKHSLTFTAYKNRPQLMCNRTRLFEIVGEKANTLVIFKEILFSRSKSNKQCQLPSKGFIHVINANIEIEDCYFWKFCSVLTLELSNPDTKYNIKVDSTVFRKTSYAISSDRLDNAFINITKSAFVGTTWKDFTSYAISIQSDGMIDLIMQHCYLREYHQGISLRFLNGIHQVLISSSYFTDIEGQVVIAKFWKEIDEEASNFRIFNSTFVNNKGLFSSALHALVTDIDDVRVVASIEECMFVDNEGRALFGTIYANGITLLISDCHFGNNVAGEYHSSIQGFGGAIYVETDTTVEAVNTTFRNNSCTGFGGAIFSRGSFRCFNCSFYSIHSTNNVRPLLGDILYATANLTLVNTNWVALSPDDGRIRPLIWHPGSPTVENWKILVNGFFDAVCPDGHNITESGVMRDNNDYTKRLTLSCKPCPRNEYSLDYGLLKVQQNDGNITVQKQRKALCYPCRYGGICNHGSIQPQPNYYGYRVGSEESNEVRFMSCPSGYCCRGDECKKYNSCQGNRTGFLCGKCKEGLSENLINANCITPDKCDDMWILPIFMMFGASYIIAFMYLDYIGLFIRSQLLWWKERNPFHDDLEDYEIVNHQEEIRHDNQQQAEVEEAEVEDRDEPDTIADLFAPTLDIFEALRDDKHPDVFTDLVSLSFYFYQMFILIRMRESVVVEYFVTQLRSLYSSVFTLSIEVNSNPFVLCPIPNLTAISKLLVMKSFSFYVLGLLFMFHGLVYLVQLKHEWNTQTVIEFSVRLKVATIRIIQLAYATLTTTAMVMVSCVNINTNFVLLIDGSVQCYTWWQGIIFFILVGWVFPFPVTLSQSLVDLKKNYITYHQFVLAWIFPFPYLCWSLYQQYQRRKLRRSRADTLDGAVNISDDDIDLNEMDQSVKEILYRMESPYKGKGNHLTREERKEYKNMKIPEPAFWSGVLIGRRLILIIIYSFVQAPVLKLYVALLICIAYLIHHMYYQPYINKASNFVETLSSSVLIVFCSMNLFFAYSYVSDVSPEQADGNLTVIFRWFEAVVLIFVPTLGCIGFSCLVLTRIFILIGHCLRYLCTIYPTRIDR